MSGGVMGVGVGTVTPSRGVAIERVIEKDNPLECQHHNPVITSEWHTW